MFEEVFTLASEKPNSASRMVRDNKERIKPERNLDPDSCQFIPSLWDGQSPMAIGACLWTLAVLVLIAASRASAASENPV